MVKPSLVPNDAGASRTLRAVLERLERDQTRSRSLRARDPSVIDGDSNRGQPKPDRRDAASRTRSAAVRHEAIVRISRIPEVIEVRFLKVIEEFVIAGERMRN